MLTTEQLEWPQLRVIFTEQLGYCRCHEDVPTACVLWLKSN